MLIPGTNATSNSSWINQPGRGLLELLNFTYVPNGPEAALAGLGAAGRWPTVAPGPMGAAVVPLGCRCGAPEAYVAIL